MHYWQLLAERNYRLLWTGQLLSTMGGAFASIGLLWYAASIGPHNIVGLMGAASAIPSVFGFLAGIAADRVDRRRLMLGIDIICAGLVICIAIIIALSNSGGVIVIAPLLILVFTISLLGEFYEPALFAYIPMLVDREKIASANSLLNTGREGMIAAAKIMAGIIASLIGITGLLVLNALTELFSALSLYFIKASHTHTKDTRNVDSAGSNPGQEHPRITGDIKSILVDLREGFSMMWKSPLISKVLPWTLPANAMYGAAVVLMPSWVIHRLDGNISLYGIIMGGGMFGIMMGTLIAPLLARYYTANFVMGIFTVVEAVFLLLFAITHNHVLAIIFFSLMGFFDGLSSPIYFSLIQIQLPEERLGQVFGSLMTFLALGQPIGMVVGGMLADKIGLAPVYYSASILIGSVGVFFITSKPLHVRLPS